MILNDRQAQIGNHRDGAKRGGQHARWKEQKEKESAVSRSGLVARFPLARTEWDGAERAGHCGRRHHRKRHRQTDRQGSGHRAQSPEQHPVLPLYQRTWPVLFFGIAARPIRPPGRCARIPAGGTGAARRASAPNPVGREILFLEKIAETGKPAGLGAIRRGSGAEFGGDRFRSRTINILFSISLSDSSEPRRETVPKVLDRVRMGRVVSVSGMQVRRDPVR